MDFNALINAIADRAETKGATMNIDLAKATMDIINEGGEAVVVKEEPMKIPALEQAVELPLTPLSDFPEYLPESENPNILIKGRWLERGGSAWWISTAGTGKSIASLQLAMLWSEGLPFAGLEPNGQKLTIWIIQSEDSPSRVTIDREDIIAELNEQYPDRNWREVSKRVKFVNIGPNVGADFIDRLDNILAKTMRQTKEKMPDLIIVNPFLAYVGGPITDGTYVTPFLRGGEINRKPTIGMQALIEKYDIGLLVFHHTSKPPTEKELDAWLKSPFPEYQGAGSADITNWGRSFITMMRVKDNPRMVMLTAGKNGNEIGWPTIDGANRRYMHWSDDQGITGKARHAWRELTEDEYAEVTHDAKVADKSNEDILVDGLKASPMTATDVRQYASEMGMSKNRFESAWKKVSKNYAEYGLVCLPAQRSGARGKVWFYGEKEAAKRAVWNYETDPEE